MKFEFNEPIQKLRYRIREDLQMKVRRVINTFYNLTDFHYKFEYITEQSLS